jgi:hypothetical protein
MTKKSSKDPGSIKMRLLSEQHDEAPLENDSFTPPFSPMSLSTKTPYTVASVPLDVGAHRGTPIPSRNKQYYPTFVLLVASIALSIFVVYYGYETLINPSPILGSLLLAPYNTVLLINIMSQAVAFLMRQLYSTLLEAVRWKFASGKNGVQLTTFLGLSAATSLHGVLWLFYEKGKHRFWCLQRYTSRCQTKT